MLDSPAMPKCPPRRIPTWEDDDHNSMIPQILLIWMFLEPSVFSEEGLSEECKTELGIHKPRFAQLRTFENLAASLQNVLLHLP